MNHSPTVDHLLLPCQSRRWPEIKRILLETVNQPSVGILHVLSQLDYVENLIHLDQPPTVRLFDVLPVRMTFVGLGDFITSCIDHTERHHFLQKLLPFIYRLAIHCEDYAKDSLPAYCVQQKAYDVHIPFDLVACIIACSFLCLLPVHTKSSLLLSEINFTYFFGGILDGAPRQVQKLRSLLSYFEQCRLMQGKRCYTGTKQQSLRIVRCGLRLETHNGSACQLVEHAEKVLVLENFALNLVERLSSVKLPLLFTDQYNPVEVVSDRLKIPMTHFVNAYIGGNILRPGNFQEDTLFMRYPDILVSLSLCHRLEEFETIWIDHFRGPFPPTQKSVCSTFGASTDKHQQNDSAEDVKWRRLVVVDSSCFPVWASELQYSDACIANEVVKATAAFYDSTSIGEEVDRTSLGPPFSQRWWSVFSDTPRSHQEKAFFPKSDASVSSTDCTKFVRNREAVALFHWADSFVSRAIAEAVQYTLVSKPIMLSGQTGSASYPPTEIPIRPIAYSTDRSLNTLFIHSFGAKHECATPLRNYFPVVINEYIQGKSIRTESDALSATTLVKHRTGVLKSLIDEVLSQSMSSAAARASRLHAFVDSLSVRLLHDASTLAVRVHRFAGRLAATALEEARHWHLINSRQPPPPTALSACCSGGAAGDVVTRSRSPPPPEGPMRHRRICRRRGPLTIEGCRRRVGGGAKTRQLSRGQLARLSSHQTVTASKDHLPLPPAATCQTIFQGFRHPVPSNEIQVSDKLKRFVGSLVTEVCTSALQRLHQSKQANANGGPQSPTSSRESRPSGLVTTACWRSGGRRRASWTGDPQVKAMTQWIAAAVATESGACDRRVACSRQHACPLVVCTDGDARLDKLDDLVGLVQRSSCSAGDLLALLYEYGAVRSSRNSCCTRPLSTGCSSSSEEKEWAPSRTAQPSLPSLFDYLAGRLQGC